MRTTISVILGSLLLFFLGCAAGGEDVSTDVGEGKLTVRDDKGFEREIKPEELEFRTAQQFLASGNYQEAISHLNTAVGINPRYLKAWSELGRVQSKLKNYEAGIQAYQQALEIEPENDALIASVAYNYLQIEDLEKSGDYYRKMIAKDSLSYDGNVHLGFIYQKLEEVDNAIRHYELALVSNPSDAMTMGSLANLYGKKGDEKNKAEYLTKAVEAAPDNYRFKTQLGSLYLKQKEYEKAIPLFEDLVENFPDMAAYHQNLGFALSQTGRKSEAAAELEKAIELKGDDPLIFAILSQIYNELGQTGKAIETSKAGLNLGKGQGAFLHYQWGVALSKQKLFDEAILKFEKVISYRDPVWTEPARKQIDRQEKLKKREELIKEKEKWE